MGELTMAARSKVHRTPDTTEAPESGTMVGTRLARPLARAVPRGAKREQVQKEGAVSTRRTASQQQAATPAGHEAETQQRPRPPLEDVDRMMAMYTPLVRQIAGGFQRKLPRNVLREDLIAAGMSGLWDAVRRHADRPTDSFEWYVRVRIRGAILDELRAQDWLPRRARAAAAEAQEQGRTSHSVAPAVVRFDDVSEWEQSRCLATGDSSNSEVSVDAKFTRESLARAVDQLPTRERHIVSSHYFRGVKFKDLGAELGVSEPRISQLHSRAMQRLRAIMGEAA